MKRDSIRPVSFLARFVVALLFGSILVLGLSGCQAVAPSHYPSKTITYIVPAVQGSSTDVECRTLVDLIPKYWLEAKIELKNVGAGGGTAAAVEVLNAKPDGYTMAQMMVSPLTTQPHMMGDQLPYKSPDDFQIVHQLLARSNVLVVKPDSKYNTVNDLIDDFKSGRRTEPFIYAGRQVGNAHQMTLEMLVKLAGLQGKGLFKHVPYGNDGEAIADVLGGHIEASNGMWASSKALVEEKQLKPLVAFIAFPGMEQYGIKSAKQLGWDMEWSPRHYHILPKGTPKEIVDIVDQKFKQALQDPSFTAFLDRVGDFEFYLGPEEAAAYLRKGFETDGELVTELGLKH